MSAIDVDGSVPAAASLARGGARGNGPANPDDGAFGALMADLHTAPGGAPAPRAPKEGKAAPAEPDAAPAKGAKSEGQGLDDLLSQVLAGAQDAAKPAPGKEGAAHGEKGRAAHAAAEKAALAATPDDAATAQATETTDAEGQVTPHGRPKLKVVPDLAQPKAEPTATDTPNADALAALRTAAAAQAAGAEQAEADDSQTAAGGPLADAAAEADAEPVDVPTMRVKVLSRETHFAPVRSFTLAPEGNAAAKADRSEDGEPETASRADAFAASPRERAAMRLDQARQQDPSATDGGAAAKATDSVKTDSMDDMLAAADGTSGSTSGLPASLPLNSLRQVSNAIGAEVARLVDPSFVSDTDTGALARSNGPLRIIAIQLQPLELGTVTVRMRLSDDGLDVRISASNPATARMLQQDQARLADLLKAQGIEAANVTVTNPSDQTAAWSRFEILPKGSSSFAGQGDGERPSGQQPEQQNSGNGRDEGENASGGRRSGRNRG